MSNLRQEIEKILQQVQGDTSELAQGMNVSEATTAILSAVRKVYTPILKQAHQELNSYCVNYRRGGYGVTDPTPTMGMNMIQQMLDEIGK